ncbi:MAG: hypothetical protein ACI8PZ_006149 [Myxococcota bacterium]
MQANQEFADWAVGWSGVNGGNPAGPLWVCGLEFGTGEDKPTLDRDRENYTVEGVPAWTDAFVRAYRTPITRSPFIRKLAKVVLAFEGRPINDYADFRVGGLLRPAGTAFHINLYPLSFRNMHGGHWSRDHYELTGFPNKLLYRAWCMQHRFPWLASHARRAAPRVLVCTGASYAEDFRYAFCADPFASGTSWSLPSGKRVEEHAIGDGTRLLITPFFGQGGLMRNDDLAALGRHARQGSQGPVRE